MAYKKLVKIHREINTSDFKVVRDAANKICTVDAKWLPPVNGGSTDWTGVTIDSAEDLADLSLTIASLRPTWCVRVRGWGRTSGTFDCGICNVLGNTEQEYEEWVGSNFGGSSCPSGSLGHFTAAGGIAGSFGLDYTYHLDTDVDDNCWQINWEGCCSSSGFPAITVIVAIVASGQANRFPPRQDDVRGVGGVPTDPASGVGKLCVFWPPSNPNEPLLVAYQHWAYGVSVADLIKPEFNWPTKATPYFYDTGGIAQPSSSGGVGQWITENCRPSGAGALELDVF